MPLTLAARANSAKSDHEAHEGYTNAELQRLQRQFRLLEGDRKAYSEESKQILHKQKHSIETLKKENLQLQEQIRLLQALTSAKMTFVKGNKVTSAEEQKEFYKKKIKGLCSEIEELDQIIENKTVQVDSQRAKLGGVNAASLNIDSIDKQIKILENRLDKALEKYNKSLASNKKLREMIDNLRRERITFDKLSKKFEKDIAEQKKQMSELIEQSNASYEARDEAQARILILREKAEKEYQAYMQEVKELDRTIEHDRKLREFLMTKAVDRTERDDSDSPKKLAKKDKDGNHAKNSSNDSLNSHIEEFEKSIAEIKKATGLGSIQEIIQHFKTAEEDNFSLFIYVNEINNEVEKLINEQATIQKKIDEIKKEQQIQEQKRHQQLKKLEVLLAFALNGKQELVDCEKNNEVYSRKHEDAKMSLKTLTMSLSKLVELFKSISSPFAEEGGSHNGLLGNKDFDTPITTENVIQILGMVQADANDVITLNHIFSYGKKNAVGSASPEKSEDEENIAPPAKVTMPLPGSVVKLIQANPLPALGKMSIVPPSTSIDDDEDEDSRIMQRAELKQRVVAKMNALGPKMGSSVHILKK